MSSPSSRFSELYSAYAAGCLDPAFALMLETQAMVRGDIRDAVAVSEMIAGAFLETTEPAAMADRALERVMSAIDAIDAPADLSRRAGKAAGQAIEELLALPEPLRAAALDSAGQRGWQTMGLGIKRLPIDAGSAMDVELYRIAPGAKLPRHTHDGAEYTLVVSGGFRDEHGSYGPGDIAVSDQTINHQPVADEDGVCIALAVRDGGLRFSGVIGFVQSLIAAR
ncbi:ChrR family anti-sigma-E factor [Hyphomonas sp.]|uniref:ChrR family anti-sigma-E factor n=1 Tax=Hyphomonas sp. TaxID=87 RepID=UPI00391ACDD5